KQPSFLPVTRQKLPEGAPTTQLRRQDMPSFPNLSRRNKLPHVGIARLAQRLGLQPRLFVYFRRSGTTMAPGAESAPFLSVPTSHYARSAAGKTSRDQMFFRYHYWLMLIYHNSGRCVCSVSA